MRGTKSKRNSRRGSISVSQSRLDKTESGVSVRHMMSPDGTYRGRKVMEIKVKKEKNIDNKEDVKKTSEVIETPDLDLDTTNKSK